MNLYQISAKTVTFPVGTVLGLSEEQARRRRHWLRKDGKNYVATAPVNFKAGEQVRVELDLSQFAAGMLRDLGLTDEQIREARTAAKAAPKAKKRATAAPAETPDPLDVD